MPSHAVPVVQVDKIKKIDYLSGVVTDTDLPCCKMFAFQNKIFRLFSRNFREREFRISPRRARARLMMSFGGDEDEQGSV